MTTKTAVQTFIEDAIAGGWGVQANGHRGVEKVGHVGNKYFYIHAPDGGTYREQTAFMLLDPIAWRAVGKTRGWKERQYVYSIRGRMHRFIDALADGDDIETALTKIQ